VKEFMLIIRNKIDNFSALSPDQQQQFLKKCMDYINDLKDRKKLIEAQPLERQGKMISGSKGKWQEGPFNESKEVIVGYYHILAEDIDEAVTIAKANPEFEYGITARIEVRPVKVKEQTTGYVYPKKI
jgi:hypothetical protein